MTVSPTARLEELAPAVYITADDATGRAVSSGGASR